MSERRLLCVPRSRPSDLGARHARRRTSPLGPGPPFTFHAAGRSAHDTFTRSIDNPAVARPIYAIDQALTLAAVVLERAVVSVLDPYGRGATFEVGFVGPSCAPWGLIGFPAAAVPAVGHQ